MCFKCDVSSLYCVILLIIDNLFMMIDKEKGLLYIENRKLFSKSIRNEVDVNNINIVDGWNLIWKLIIVNGIMFGLDIIVY